MAVGPPAGLEIVTALLNEPSLRDYHLLPTVHADLLEKLGRYDEARGELERAAALTNNVREQQLLRDRAARARAEPGSDKHGRSERQER
jgi:predicted RNA polymerase sigma factor